MNWLKLDPRKLAVRGAATYSITRIGYRLSTVTQVTALNLHGMI